MIGGVVDSDYRGEIQALLLNWSDTPFQVNKGQRICQGLFLPVQQNELPSSGRCDFLFGSTGM